MSGEALALDHPFWRFSLAVYARPGVRDECLEIQRLLGADVNLLLFCAWLGCKGRSLEADHLARAKATVASWHEAAVRPLRAVRQTIKTLPEMACEEVKALRNEVSRAELRAEQIEQALLFRLEAAIPAPAKRTSPAETVRENIGNFLRSHQGSAGVVEPPRTERLVAAALEQRAQATPDKDPVFLERVTREG